MHFRFTLNNIIHICMCSWALVKDKEVAKKMIKFIEVNTIGVSKESQHRAAKILEVISDGCQEYLTSPPNNGLVDNFFQYSKNVMAKRWDKLRHVLNHTQLFTLPKYPLQYCNFTRDFAHPHPGKLIIYSL